MGDSWKSEGSALFWRSLRGMRFAVQLWGAITPGRRTCATGMQVPSGRRGCHLEKAAIF